MPINHLFQKKETIGHVLFVDDSAVLLRTVKGFVPPKYKVSLATNAEQAFKVINQSAPDLIFLDYEMPDINGAQLLARIRSNPELGHIPVVFLSSNPLERHLGEIMDLNPAGYILKPPVADRIIGVIEKYLEK